MAAHAIPSKLLWVLLPALTSAEPHSLSSLLVSFLWEVRGSASTAIQNKAISHQLQTLFCRQLSPMKEHRQE